MASVNNASLSQHEVDQARIRASHKVQGAPPPPMESDAKPEGVENLCPFGCVNDELTDIGHCRHLIGFSNNGKTYEPQVKRMRPAREADGKFIRDEAGKVMKEWDGAVCTDGRHPQLVKAGDIKVSVGVSMRIYREDPDEKPETEVFEPIREPSAAASAV